jgi:hypothetical protein
MAQGIRLSRRPYRVTFVVLWGVLTCAAANAATVTAKLSSLEQTTFNVTVKNQSGSYSVSGGAGKFHWDGSVAGGSNPAGLNGTFTSFCIDLKDFVKIGSTFTYTVADLEDAPILNGSAGINYGLSGGMGADKANVLSLLFGQHYNDVVNAATAGAFQAAIWEIVYEDGVPANFNNYDVTDYDPLNTHKGFKVNTPTSVTNTANAWLRGLSSTGARMSLAALTSAKYQDQIIIVPTPTAVMAGFGLLGTLGLAKLVQRWRKNQAMV